MGNIACLMAAGVCQEKLHREELLANAKLNIQQITSALPAGFLVAIKDNEYLNGRKRL